MKKIMFFINTLAGGGAERVLTNLLKVLDYNKYDITVIAITGGENLKEVPPQVKVRQIIKSKSKLASIYNSILHKLPSKLFASLYLKGDYDIEIAYLPGFPTRMVAAKKSKAKKIAFIHGKIDEGTLKILGYSNKKECLKEYNTYNSVCFVSDDAKHCFETQVGALDNSLVVYNVINHREIREKAKEVTDISYTTIGVKFIAVGRLVEIKGFERLLHVVAELKDKYDFELWILGQGELYKKLSDYISDNGLDNVKLLGYQDNPYKYMAQADCLVCSSFSEGYSAVAIEALTLGIPVIATDCPGMKEVLTTDGCGLIVENSEMGLRDGMEHILKDTEAIMKIKNNALKYSENCEFDKELQQYTRLFDEI